MSGVVWVVPTLLPGRRAEGAADCMVVNVVVKERTEGAGEENVLPSPPSIPFELRPPPVVPLVSAFDCVSECTVSGYVPSVRAGHLALDVRGCRPSLDVRSDCLLCERDSSLILLPEGGV